VLLESVSADEARRLREIARELRADCVVEVSSMRGKRKAPRRAERPRA
jgi:sugar phosphate isomerase/epimerase